MRAKRRLLESVSEGREIFSETPRVWQAHSQASNRTMQTILHLNSRTCIQLLFLLWSSPTSHLNTCPRDHLEHHEIVPQAGACSHFRVTLSFTICFCLADAKELGEYRSLPETQLHLPQITSDHADCLITCCSLLNLTLQTFICKYTPPIIESDLPMQTTSERVLYLDASSFQLKSQNPPSDILERAFERCVYPLSNHPSTYPTHLYYTSPGSPKLRAFVCDWLNHVTGQMLKYEP